MQTSEIIAIKEAALSYINCGFKVLPCKEKSPTDKIKRSSKFRTHPIHEKNYDFYFDGAPQIAIFTGDCVSGNPIEVADIDSKNDLTGRLNKNVLSTIEFSNPEIYDKLVIDQTPSGGYHFLYKCAQVGGSKSIALRKASATELLKGERKKILIENIGQGKYIVCSPSPGYKLIKGEIENLETLSIEERNFLHAILKSFDLTGQHNIPEVSKRRLSAPDSPWNVFNKEHDHKWMLEALQNAGWEMVDDTDDLIRVLRPGSNAKSSGSIWKESNCLYLFTTSSEFESEKPYSAFDIHRILKYDGDFMACAKDLAVQGVGIWNDEESEFYTISEKNRIEIRQSAIIDWMSDIGLVKHWYAANDFNIVQAVDNIVRPVSIDKIKKIFGDYIKDKVSEKILDTFLRSLKSLFSKEGLISQLEDLNEDLFLKSTPSIAWLFFKNGALKVTGNDADIISYESLSGYVWERNILKRNFLPGEKNGEVDSFIKIISGQRKDIELMYVCAIGYLLHRYKDPACPKVIILNDEFYDDNGTEPQGGTGKGLFIKLFSYFRNTYSIDGKSFNHSRSFVWQGVSHETELIAFEDVDKRFDFEKLFSVVTEAITVEQKGRDPFPIVYEKSPKILITSNYAIKGSSSSHLRRRYELEVAPFFSHKKTPLDHFGHRLFEDWNDDQWLLFDNYMVSCLQSFLSNGLPEEITVNLKRKKLIQETNPDFVRWMDTFLKESSLPEKISKEAFKEKFTNMYPDFKIKLTTAKFTQWLIRWSEDNKVSVDARNQYNGVMVYAFECDKNIVKSLSTFPEAQNQKALKIEELTVSNEPERVNGWHAVENAEPF